MALIVSGDWHLDLQPENEYRWEFLEWLRDRLSREDALLFLGDLTHAKNEHSDELVNRVVSNILMLRRACDRIILLRGNHDYHKDPSTPFFGFLGEYPGIDYILNPVTVAMHGVDVFCIPHSRGLEPCVLDEMEENVDAVAMHHEFVSTGPQGQMLPGDDVYDWPFGERYVFNGHIHVPQYEKMEEGGVVECVGAPYPVRFGDTYTGHVLRVVDGEGVEDVEILDYTDAPAKRTVRVHRAEELEKLRDAEAGDYVKVKVYLPRSEFGDWRRRKEEVREVAEDLGLVVYSVELEELKRRSLHEGKELDRGVSSRSRKDEFDGFCEAQEITGEDVVDVGEEIVCDLSE